MLVKVQQSRDLSIFVEVDENATVQDVLVEICTEWDAEPAELDIVYCRRKVDKDVKLRDLGVDDCSDMRLINKSRVALKRRASVVPPTFAPGASEVKEADMTQLLRFRKPDGGDYHIKVRGDETFGDIKKRNEGIWGIPAASTVLIWGGRPLKDDATCSSMSLTDGTVVHVVGRGLRINIVQAADRSASFSIDIARSATVGDLLVQICREWDAVPGELGILYTRRRLEPDERLAELGLEDDSLGMVLFTKSRRLIKKRADVSDRGLVKVVQATDISSVMFLEIERNATVEDLLRAICVEWDAKPSDLGIAFARMKLGRQQVLRELGVFDDDDGMVLMSKDRKKIKRRKADKEPSSSGASGHVTVKVVHSTEKYRVVFVRIDRSAAVNDLLKKVSVDLGVDPSGSILLYGRRKVDQHSKLADLGANSDSCFILVAESNTSPEKQAPEPTARARMAASPTTTAPEKKEADVIHLKICELNGNSMYIRVHVDETFGDIKKRHEGSWGLPAESMKIIFAGRHVPDDATCRSMSIANETVLHLIRRTK